MQMATHSTNYNHMWSGSDGLLLRCKGDGYHDMPGNLCRWYCLSLEHMDGRSVMTTLLLSTLIFILQPSSRFMMDAPAGSLDICLCAWKSVVMLQGKKCMEGNNMNAESSSQISFCYLNWLALVNMQCFSLEVPTPY